MIRDHIGTTPLANLQTTLTADMQKIWDTLSKPPELKDKQLSDYFDLSFAALPHKVLAADKFENEVQELRKRFSDKSRPDYVFSPAYHKRIPADGVAFYMEGIWVRVFTAHTVETTHSQTSPQEQVQTNKDLDLPTQRELLAQFRCDEISSAALQEFNEQAKPQKRPIESGKVVEGLGKMMRAWRSGALERYDRDASRYHPGVYKRKRADLVGVLDSTLSPLFFGQLKNLHKASLAAYKKEMLDGVRGEGYNFAEVVAAARMRLEKRFLAGAQEALVEGTDWTYEEELGLLREEARSVADQCRKDETKKMVNVIEVRTGSITSEVCCSQCIRSATSKSKYRSLSKFTSTSPHLTCGTRSSRSSVRLLTRLSRHTSRKPRVSMHLWLYNMVFNVYGRL